METPGESWGNMRESWGNHRGIGGEIGETLKGTKVSCNSGLSLESL